MAPLVVGAVLGVAVWLVLFRSQAPGGAFEPVGGNETKFCRGRIIAASKWPCCGCWAATSTATMAPPPTLAA